MINSFIGLTFKDVWTDDTEMMKDIITPLSATYAPYWDKVEAVLKWKDLYNYFKGYYGERFIMYSREIFIARFRMIMHNELVNFYKHSVIVVDDLWVQFKEKTNLGKVIDKTKIEVNTRTASGENDMSSKNNALESNESTLSTFAKIIDDDGVSSRHLNEVTSHNETQTDITDKMDMSNKGNETHIFNELVHIMNKNINLGIIDLIVKFNGLFASFYVPDISQNNHWF